QRIAIARAILADAPLLVLDEATSSLDSVTEAEVQIAVDELIRGRTAIIIAHRLSTVRNVDRILVFEDGAIVEEGEYDALAAKLDGHFRTLHQRQVVGLV
ncbi:MAG: ABC transporter ATP-binding protein, partial [Parvibaculaceae bacterium]|nr:ABC transporter ATP-binding protein [Parvibaculaceae bacterium]